MTREEASVILTEYRKKLINSVSNQLDKDIEAFDMAIQALENEEEVYMRGYEQGRKDLVNAIGKVKAESKVEK